jgi:hypothetical protein
MKKLHLIPLFIGLIYLVHGSILGLSDDEAYYWVWSQYPNWSYAYHPPMAGWLIYLFSFTNTVRFPAAIIAGILLYLSALWMKKQGVPKDKINFSLITLISFVGFFGLAWMIVPDTPLYLGWILAFYSTWSLCFSKFKTKNLFILGLGVWIAMLSKYSGILVPVSASLAILMWGAKPTKWKSIVTIACSSILAAIPVLIWNMQHEWASLLYQVQERHGGGISFTRYGKFWLIQLALAGPGLFFYALTFVQRRKFTESEKYIGIWALPPALIFGLQPLFADFKPHWALVAWLPVALGFSLHAAMGSKLKFLKAQIAYGLSMIAIVLIACHLPLGGLLAKDPRMDVTNDFYGWDSLKHLIKEDLPIMGNRYQTAAQAAYALKDAKRVSLVPRDIKAMDEWADFKKLGIVDSNGPRWPRLLKAAYFVADHRYTDGPAFEKAKCKSMGRAETKRGPYSAKWIEIWKCVPKL